MIQRLYVHNYRCFENFELRLGAMSSVLLIGRNGSGKSTVRSVLELFQSIARGTNRVRDLVDPAECTLGRSGVPIRFEIEVTLADGNVYAYELAFELPDGFKEMRVAHESLTVNGNSVFYRDKAKVSLEKGTDVSFQVDWHLVALPVILVRDESDPIHMLRAWFTRMVIIAPSPRLIDGYSTGDCLTPNLDVSNFGEWFTGLLSQSPSAYAAMDTFVREVMPDFTDIKNPIIGPDSRALSVQFQHGDDQMTVPFGSLSDGEKCYFICSLVLAAQQSCGPIFCFWDEPDNHLALSEVAHFVMALRRAFQAGGQILVTTHHSESIRSFSDENTLYLYRRSHVEPTGVRPIGDLGIHGDYVDALIRGDVEP